MAHCPQCGAANPAQANFCFECGRPLFEPAVDPAAPVRKPRRSWVTVILVVINLLLLLTIQLGLLFAVPTFAAMFSDFGSRLPVMTESLVTVSAFWRGGWIGLNAAIVALALWGKRKIAPANIRLCLTLLAVLQGVLLMTMFIALALPIAELGTVAGGLE